MHEGHRLCDQERDLEFYHDNSLRPTECFGLRYEKIPGPDTLVRKILHDA